MKKQFMLWLLMAVFLVPWVTQAQSAPSSLNCTFENDSDTVGWVLENDSQVNKWHVGTATANSSFKSLYISNDGGSSNAYSNSSTTQVFAYKELSLAAGMHYLSFDWKCVGDGGYDYLQAYLVPSSATIEAGSSPEWEWETLSETLYGYNSWQNHFVEFSIATAGTYYVVFYWYNDGIWGDNPPAAIDNIVLAPLTCPPTMVTNIITTFDSAYFYWTNTANSYVLEFADSAFTPGMNQASVNPVSDTFFALESLMPSTTYHYALLGICDDDDSSRYVTGTFLTQCVASGVPYGYGAEPSDSAATCWDFLSYSYYTPGLMEYISHSGTNSLYLPVTSYAVLPMLTDPLEDLIISFYAKTDVYWGTNAATLSVGYMTDVNDPYSFVAISQIASPDAWMRIDVAFPDTITYPAGSRIVIQTEGFNDEEVYIDDILVDTKPTCPAVLDLTAQATAGAALASWTYQEGVLEGAPSNYIVEYALASEPDNRTQATEINGTSATLSNLTPNSRYMLWAYVNCGDERGYGDSITFTTAALSCAEYGRDTIVTVGDGVTSLVTIFPEYYENRYQQSLYRASDIRDSGDIASIAFQRAEGLIDEVSFSNVVILLGTTADTTVRHGYITPDSAFTTVYSGELTFSGDGWITIPFSHSFHYDGQSTLVVSIITHETNTYDYYGTLNFCYTNAVDTMTIFSQEYSPIYANNPMTLPNDDYPSQKTWQPNIQFNFKECVSEGSCAAPALAVSNVTADSVTLSWTPGYQESEWNVYLKTANATVWQLVQQGTTELSIAIGDLNGGTDYNAMVVAVCDDGDSMSATVSFSTPCGMIRSTAIPYTFSIAANPNPTSYWYDTPKCWFSHEDGDAAYGIYDSSVGGRNNVLFVQSTAEIDYGDGYIYPGTSSMLITPMIENLSGLELVFDMYNMSSFYYSKVVVGVLDDPDSLSSFVAIDTISTDEPGLWEPKSVSFDTYSGNGHYIAFVADSACYDTVITENSAFFSNIALYEYSECRPVAGAVASGVTYEAVTITVTGAEATDNHIVYYNTVNDMATATSMSFTGASVQLTALNHSSVYYVWVTKSCGDDESRPVMLSFTTMAPCLEVENLQVQTSGANNSAVLSWDAPNGGFAATDYIVSYKEISATTWTSDTVDVAQCYYHIIGLLQDVEYQYAVTTLCNEYVGVSNSGTFTILNSCVVIGSNEMTNSYVPFYSNYNYSYSQFIYTATELANMGDTIRGMYFYNNGTSFNTVTTSIYVGNTLLDAFTQGETTWTDATTMTKVANDTSVIVSGTGWTYFPFATPFVRDNTKNLIVAIDNNTGAYDWEYPEWAAYTTNNIRSKCHYSDDVNVNPDSVVTTAPSYFASNVPYVRFNSDCANEYPCAAPILISSSATDTTITVNWFAGTNDTSWNVMYRMVGDAAWTTFLTATTESTATITGLQSGVQYDVRVTNHCSTDSTLYAQDLFSTTCGNIHLPYVENFEAQPAGVYARSCWYAATIDEEDEEMPIVLLLTNYSKMVTLRNGAYIVAPSFTTPISETMVNFSYWCNDTRNAKVYVGVIADPVSIGTFVPFDTIAVADIAHSNNATVRFDGYTDSLGGHICFYVPIGAPYGYDAYMCLDNIEFREAVSCGTVDSIWTVNSTTTAIDVAWSVDGIAPTSYTVEYGVSGFTQGQGTTITATTASATLSGLSHSTMYDVYVTPICGTTTMFASVPYATQTACDLMAVPYSMNFDLGNLPPLSRTGVLPMCWAMDTLPRANIYSDFVYPQIALPSSTDQYSSAPASLYFEDEAVVALPMMNVPLDSLQISFYTYSSSSSYILQVGVVDSVAPGFVSSFTHVATINPYGGVRDTVTFCTYEGSGQYIAFKNFCPDGYGYTYLYVDDVVVDYRPNCMPIYGLTVDNLMMTSLTLNWATCSENSSYEVRYALAGTEAWTTLTTLTNTVTVTGLQNNSTYEFQVRNICVDGGTTEWVSITQTMPPCDGFIDANLYNPDAFVSEGNYIIAYSFYDYSFSQVVYDSAMLAQQGLDGMMVENFAFYPTTMEASTYYNDCRIFISSTTKTTFDNSTDFVAVDSADLVYTGDLNWTEVGWREVILDSAFIWDGHSNIIITIDRDHGDNLAGAKFQTYPGNTNQSVYWYSDDNNLNPFNPTYDDVSDYSGLLSTVPAYRFYGCPSSPCNEAPEVTVDATTATTADISWASAAIDFEVNIKPVADANWPATDVAVNGTYTYSFTGLMPATQYQYRVRAICGENETSEWATATLITDSMPCFVPTNLAASTTMGSVELSWTVGRDETAWNIHVWNTAFDSIFNAIANPFSVIGFTQGTEYQAAIQSVCGGGIVTSEYSDTIAFTTDVCDPVTNVTATAQGTSVTVTWAAGENNTGNFAVEYGINGFAAGHGTTVNVTTNSVTITDLEEEIIYDVYVRAVCDGQYNSVWSEPATFTTEVGINTVAVSNIVSIYPNPAEQSTTISVSGVEGDVTVTIVDMNGRAVSTYTLVCNGDCEKSMNVENLAAGSYFVRLQGNGLNTVKKLVIK